MLALLAVASYGMGYGLVVPPTNLSAAEAGGASMVSLLNFAWGIGAVACSPLVILSLRHHSLSAFLWVLAIVGFALALDSVSFRCRDGHHDDCHGSRPGRQSIPRSQSPLSLRRLFFFYVGTETSIGGWAAEHTKRLAGHATS